MTRQLGLQALPGFLEDMRALPDDATRQMAVHMLVLVRDGKISGIRLGAHAADLRDCFKLYFDPDGSAKPRYRLVYRFSPNEIAAVAVEAVAVGRRQNLEVYRRAATSLDRDESP